MNVGALTRRELAKQLSSAGIVVRLGPFRTRIRSCMRTMFPLFREMYEAYPLETDPGVNDFDVQIRPSSPLRLGRRQAWFLADGRAPFWPMPAAHRWASS